MNPRQSHPPNKMQATANNTPEREKEREIEREREKYLSETRTLYPKCTSVSYANVKRLRLLIGSRYVHNIALVSVLYYFMDSWHQLSVSSFVIIRQGRQSF